MSVPAGGIGDALRGLGRWASRTLVEAPLPLVAVEVRPRALAAVRLAREGGRLALGAAGTVDLPEGALEVSLTKPNVTGPEAFGSALRAVLERVGAFAGGPVSLVLPDPSVRATLVASAGIRGRRSAHQDTFIHRLDPRIKLVTTLIFIVSVLSFDKYRIAGLIPIAMYPVVLIALGNLPAVYLGKKILLAVPFAFFIGIFNPFMDRALMLQLGPIGISGGWVSFASIMTRFILTVSAALILIASTGFNTVCMALERLGAPRLFSVQLLFLFRYIFVLVDEASRMVRARALRSFGGRGMGFGV